MNDQQQKGHMEVIAERLEIVGTKHSRNLERLRDKKVSFERINEEHLKGFTLTKRAEEYLLAYRKLDEAMWDILESDI